MYWTIDRIKSRLDELYPDRVIQSLKARDNRVYSAIHNYYGGVEKFAEQHGYTLKAANKAIESQQIRVAVKPLFPGLRVNYMESLMLKINKEHPEIHPFKTVILAMEALRNGSYDKQIFEYELQKKRVS